MKDLPLFYRTCRVNIGGRVLTYPDITIEFETNFATRAVESGMLKIYNPSEKTIKACEAKGRVKPTVIIEAGYREDSGTCFTGEVIRFEHKKDYDSTLEIKISDKTSLWSNAIVTKSFTGPIRASQVIKAIFDEKGLKSSIELKEDKTYDIGISFSNTSLRKAMQMLARDTQSDFFFRSGKAIFLPREKGMGRAIVLKPDTGLLKAGKTGRKTYKIRSLFLYYIGAGSLISLYGDKLLRIYKGKKVFSSFSESYIECEAKLL